MCLFCVLFSSAAVSFEIVGGFKRWQTQCTYDFYSQKNNRHGRFSSPSYPQTYAPGSKCQYIFYGQRHETIRIHFVAVRLGQSEGRSAWNSAKYINPFIHIIYERTDYWRKWFVLCRWLCIDLCFRSKSLIAIECQIQRCLNIVFKGGPLRTDFNSQIPNSLRTFLSAPLGECRSWSKIVLCIFTGCQRVQVFWV